MLDKILMFIKERLVALNTAINGVSNRVSNLDTRVSNNADVTNRNSSRISNLESDTGWQHLSRSTNWNGADDYVVYRKVGRTVEVRFKVEPKSNWGVADSIMMAHDMPSSIIPQGNIVIGLAYHNGSAYRINIPAKGQSNAGQIRIQGKNTMTSGAWVVGQVCYTV